MRHPVRIVFTLLLTLASACSLIPAPATPTSATPELTPAGGIDSAATELAATRLAAVEETMAAFTAIAQNPPLEAEKLIDGLLEPERRRQKRQMVEAMESMLRAVYDARR